MRCRIWKFASALVMFASVLALTAAAQGQTTQAYRAAHRPNVDIDSDRRSYTTDEKVSFTLSVYNTHTVELAAFRIRLQDMIRSSRDLEHMDVRVARMDMGGRRAVQTHRITVKDVAPDDWTKEDATLKGLPPGVYLIRARAAGAEKRTWIAVTDVALLTKRSRRELIVFATDAITGRPIANMDLSSLDSLGSVMRGATDSAGVWRRPLPPGAQQASDVADTQGNLWLYGERRGSPAFVLAGAPPPPEPYGVYILTDRPIYRPGQTALYKATIRRRLVSDDPGGFTYKPYARQKVTLEIRDPTDALIARHEATTNEAGTLDGDLLLAAEPALGRWQIVTVIGKYRSYGSFEVQAYRKPEYSVNVQFTKPHYLGGDTVPAIISARYYFGQPVAGAAVQYAIRFQPKGQGEVEPTYTAEGVTNSLGELRLDIKTRRLPINRTLSVSATVTDLSRRSQQATGSALITAGSFRLSLQTDRYVYRPRDRVTVTVHAEDYDGRPVAAPVAVRLIETKYDRDRRPYRETTVRKTTTDAKGSGTVEFQPPRPGYLQLEAEAFDSADDKILATGYVWVSGEDVEGYDYPTLSLTADRATYKPGEVATLLLNTNLIADKRPQPTRKSLSINPHPLAHTEAWALVSIEGERIYHHEVVHLTRRSTALRIPLAEAHYPSIHVSAVIVMDRSIYEETVQLEVPLDRYRLVVRVAADGDKLAPGEKVAYTVETRDARGRRVPAEVALSVVDSSIYAIRPDSAPDLMALFHGGQEVRVQTDFSFAAQYSGGAYQNVPKAAAPIATADGIRVRRNFQDTAYWNPVIAT